MCVHPQLVLTPLISFLVCTKGLTQEQILQLCKYTLSHINEPSEAGVTGLLWRQGRGALLLFRLIVEVHE